MKKLLSLIILFALPMNAISSRDKVGLALLGVGLPGFAYSYYKLPSLYRELEEKAAGLPENEQYRVLAKKMAVPVLSVVSVLAGVNLLGAQSDRLGRAGLGAWGVGALTCAVAGQRMEKAKYNRQGEAMIQPAYLGIFGGCLALNGLGLLGAKAVRGIRGLALNGFASRAQSFRARRK